MAKTMFTARLDDQTHARLARLRAAEPNLSEADIVGDALFAYERGKLPIAQRVLLDLYDRAGECIMPLQHLEDERTLTPDEQEVLNFLNRVWDEARKLNLFTEPSLPPEAWEK